MDLTCPKCNQQLPEVETIPYRFCPHCGAEIDAEPQPLAEADLTIPPDLPPTPVDAEPLDPSPAPGRIPPADAQFDDQTIAPQPFTPENRPLIKPPAEPPPPSFFRKQPATPDVPPPTPKIQLDNKVDLPPPKPSKKPATQNHQKLIIAVLLILALVILILGGLFTF